MGKLTRQRNTRQLTTNPSLMVFATPTDTGHCRTSMMTVFDHPLMIFLMAGKPLEMFSFPPRNLRCCRLLVDQTSSPSQMTDLLTLPTEPDYLT